MYKNKHKTVIVSDIHLGKPNAQTEKFIDFLSNTEIETLIINWDFIDFWQLTILGKRTEKETKVINYIIERMNKWMKVIYIKGNHDAFIKKIHHIHIPTISIVNEYIHTTVDNKKYYICHGENFDFINHHMIRLGKLANLFYTIIYLVEKKTNKHMSEKWYLPISERVKMRFKKILFPKKVLHKKAIELAKKKDCDGIIIGHYHMADHIRQDGKEYLNTWYRVISCTAIKENKKGKLELFYHDEQ